MARSLTHKQVMWNLLTDLLFEIEEICFRYDSQLKITARQFLDYTEVTIHYTKYQSERYIIYHVEDFEQIIKAVESLITLP